MGWWEGGRLVLCGFEPSGRGNGSFITMTFSDLLL